MIEDRVRELIDIEDVSRRVRESVGNARLLDDKVVSVAFDQARDGVLVYLDVSYDPTFSDKPDHQVPWTHKTSTVFISKGLALSLRTAEEAKACIGTVIDNAIAMMREVKLHESGDPEKWILAGVEQ